MLGLGFRADLGAFAFAATLVLSITVATVTFAFRERRFIRRVSSLPIADTMNAQFTIARVMAATCAAAILLQLNSLFPSFLTTWLILAVWSQLLSRRPLVCCLQVLSMVVLMLERLDFGRDLDSFVAPWLAEEGAVVAVFVSGLILVVHGLSVRLNLKPRDSLDAIQ